MVGMVTNAKFELILGTRLMSYLISKPNIVVSEGLVLFYSEFIEGRCCCSCEAKRNKYDFGKTRWTSIISNCSVSVD